jgi:predicted AlkP superfamily phosphohydrolase/phosphomutase
MMQRGPTRLAFSLGTAALLGAVLTSCGRETVDHPNVIVVGFDGMDPRLCERLMDAGELPNLNRMRLAGGYSPLGTSTPPQSPVAWSNFITGGDPGGHGIYDFIHRDPEAQCAPYYSASQTIGGEEGWEVAGCRIPLTFWPFNHEAPKTILTRGGKPFWDYLDEAGVPVWIYDIPAHYPAPASPWGNVHCLSGMGVPDLMGGYGTYQFFSEDVFAVRREAGGMRRPLEFTRHAATGTLAGPENSYCPGHEPLIPFTVYRHPTEPSARIEVQDQTIVLKEGEWSDWTEVEFELEMPPFMPNSHVSGICRFYLQQVHPTTRLYATPININPVDPGGQKVTEPPEFLTALADELGLFYTSGFQEDHKALSNRVFTDEDYRRQADYVLAERLRLLDYAMDQYEHGFFFFYFSSTDLQAHMFWWDSDEEHPVRSPEEAQRYHQVIVDLYKRMDGVVGDVVKRYGDRAVILVMSDHGFGNFRRQFNLNTWLREEGYLQPPNCRSLMTVRPLVDWSRTSAYGLGLNGLYVNLRGRERDGIVDPSDRDVLLNEIAEKLLAVRDPENGRPVIAKVYRAEEVYSGPYVDKAPDLLIGYYRDYRASWATTLGDITAEVISDNRSAWSADHCIATAEVPGVVFSNRPIERLEPTLVDLAPTILGLYGLEPSEAMTGGSLFAPAALGAGGRP